MPQLPDEVRRFLLAGIVSVPHLEAVLLMRSEPSESWTSARISRRLYILEPDAASLLGVIRASGVALEVEPGSFRYGPTPELADLIDRVAEHYASDLLGITKLIHSRMDRRAQRFADAFRIRKEGDET